MAEIGSISTTPSINVLVNRFLDAERTPVKKLESRKSKLTNQSSVLLDLKSKLKKVGDRIDTFTTIGEEETLSAKEVSVSDSTIFTAEATHEASLGVSTLFVSRIAKNDIALSDRFTKTDTSLADDYAGKTKSFYISIGSGSTQTISVSFDSDSTTNEEILEEIADAINDADLDISAKVVADTSTTVRLSFVSDEAGSDYEINLSDTNNGNNGLLKNLGFISKHDSRPETSGSSGGFIYADSDELDAQFTLNGIQITRSSNKIEDVLTGVTITLKKAQSADDEPETLTVSQDVSTIREQLNNFIQDYNDAITYLKEKTGIDSSTRERGVLSGRYTYQNLKIRMRTIVSQKVSGIESGKPQTIRDLGIKTNTDGTLEIDDEDKLEEALEQGPTTVSDLITSENGIGTQLKSEIYSFTRTGGTIDDTTRGISNLETNYNKSIERYESRLKFREEALRKQFAELQKTLTILNSQQVMLQRTGLGTYGGMLFGYGSQSSSYNMFGLGSYY